MILKKFRDFYQKVILAQKKFLLDGKVNVKIETSSDEPIDYIDDGKN